MYLAITCEKSSMGKQSHIEWTDGTHNFWYGCKKVSQGCKGCYAEREMTRYGKHFSVVTRAKGFDAPLRWKEPRKVFVNSWSDFFIEEADDWRDEAWGIIKRTRHLSYQILTKRPERIEQCLPQYWGSGWPNVWLGVTVENQEMVDTRLPWLLDIPAAVRFISAEPLLEPLTLSRMLPDITWCIVGGESGPGARRMPLSWVRSIRDQCAAAGVPLFVKQLSGASSRPLKDLENFPIDLQIREFPEQQLSPAI